MEMNLNYRGTYAENKLVREMTRIIRENEENAKRQNQTGNVFTRWRYVRDQQRLLHKISAKATGQRMIWRFLICYR